jgi:hypothetical protein
MMRRIAIVPLIGLLVGMMGGVAQADGPPEVFPVDVQFQEVNPCTGEGVTVSLTGEVRVHEFFNEAGDMHHFNTVAVLDAETSDGFFGKDIEAQAHSAEGPFAPTEEEEWGMELSVINAILRNPETNQVIRAQITLHLTYKNFEFIVNSESFSVECRGVPA